VNPTLEEVLLPVVGLSRLGHCGDVLLSGSSSERSSWPSLAGRGVVWFRSGLAVAGAASGGLRIGVVRRVRTVSYEDFEGVAGNLGGNPC
jgi:hypothetical protein